MNSPLEEALLNAQSAIDGAEHQIDILRQILIGEIGTKDQRSMLIRIIKQNSPTRPMLPRLAVKLGVDTSSTSAYVRNSYF